MTLTGFLKFMISRAAVARSPRFSERTQSALSIRPVLKSKETAASNSCCASGTVMACRTRASNFVRSRAKTENASATAASRSAGIPRGMTVGSGAPAAAVWPMPQVHTPTSSRYGPGTMPSCAAIAAMPGELVRCTAGACARNRSQA